MKKVLEAITTSIGIAVTSLKEAWKENILMEQPTDYTNTSPIYIPFPKDTHLKVNRYCLVFDKRIKAVNRIKQRSQKKNWKKWRKK